MRSPIRQCFHERSPSGRILGGERGYLARRGYDVYRDLVNTPGFLDLLPDVRGLTGLDVGCGEGHNTGLVASRGAAMTGIDISPSFIRHAKNERQSRIHYAVASGQRLPFADGAFDFGTAFMSLMDMPQPELALCEAARVLKPGGFLQFSIVHPCFLPPHRKLLRDLQQRAYAVEVGRYFEGTEGVFQEWLFTGAPPELKEGLRLFRVPIFHRTLSGLDKYDYRCGSAHRKAGRASRERRNGGAFYGRCGYPPGRVLPASPVPQTVIK